MEIELILISSPYTHHPSNIARGLKATILFFSLSYFLTRKINPKIIHYSDVAFFRLCSFFCQFISSFAYHSNHHHLISPGTHKWYIRACALTDSKFRKNKTYIFVVCRISIWYLSFRENYSSSFLWCCFFLIFTFKQNKNLNLFCILLCVYGFCVYDTQVAFSYSQWDPYLIYSHVTCTEKSIDHYSIVLLNSWVVCLYFPCFLCFIRRWNNH